VAALVTYGIATGRRQMQGPKRIRPEVNVLSKQIDGLTTSMDATFVPLHVLRPCHTGSSAGLANSCRRLIAELGGRAKVCSQSARRSELGLMPNGLYAITNLPLA